jgi:D-alanyl-D-alanine carboxypeptidase
VKKALKFVVFLLFPIFCLVGVNADAAVPKKKKLKTHFDFTKGHRYAGLVVNAETGDVLYQKNASRQLHPASLVKLMTIYVTFRMLDEGQISLDDKLPISIKAASQPKMNLRLKPNQEITVRQALLGLIVHSANDAAVVLAEAISGTESSFAAVMTNTARLLGMKNTTFKNASGLPHTEQVTTAYDMAKLGIALRRDFPHYYDMFAETSFNFNGRVINSHNRVLLSYQWADGLKTGFVNASGFNLITSTSRDDGKLIGVVMGGPTAHARDTHMVKLLDHGYNKLSNTVLAHTKKDTADSAFAVAAQDMANGDSAEHLIVKAKSVFEVAAQNFHNQITFSEANNPPEDVTTKVKAKSSKKQASIGKSKGKKATTKSKRKA